MRHDLVVRIATRPVGGTCPITVEFAATDNVVQTAATLSASPNDEAQRASLTTPDMDMNSPNSLRVSELPLRPTRTFCQRSLVRATSDRRAEATFFLELLSRVPRIEGPSSPSGWPGTRRARSQGPAVIWLTAAVRCAKVLIDCANDWPLPKGRSRRACRCEADLTNLLLPTKTCHNVTSFGTGEDLGRVQCAAPPASLNMAQHFAFDGHPSCLAVRDP